jgi:superfamily II DNA/RNA helicase
MTLPSEHGRDGGPDGNSMTFEDLGLGPELLKTLTDAGYTAPTPIQAQVIPAVLMGRDVLGCAQTGTGKTASFTLPMIEILAAGRAKARMPRSLILAPTRELAAQVADNFQKFGKHHKLTKALIIGGESMRAQLDLLDRGVDVLITTPGRLLDIFDLGSILLNDVKILVIDGADRMLDMGGIPDVERIVGLLPKIRQTLFFSATLGPEIRRLSDAFLTNPKEITVSPASSTATTAGHAVDRENPRLYKVGVVEGCAVKAPNESTNNWIDTIAEWTVALFFFWIAFIIDLIIKDTRGGRHK